MPRKTAKIIAYAFKDRETRKLKNTRTNGLAIYLHNNLIVYRQDGEVYFTLAGWNTSTTRSRLNDFFDCWNVPIRICTRKGQAILGVYEYWVLEHKEGAQPRPMEVRWSNHPIEDHRVYKISDFTQKGNIP